MDKTLIMVILLIMVQFKFFYRLVNYNIFLKICVILKFKNLLIHFKFFILFIEQIIIML